MCQNASDQTTSTIHELHLAGGTARLCSGCGCVAVRFGTSYLVFTESEFFSFVAWFHERDWEGLADGEERIHVQVGGDGPVRLVLTEAERRSLDALLTGALRWVLEHRANPVLLAALAADGMPSATVH